MNASDEALDPLVRIRDLRVTFRIDKHNAFEAVKGISFDIPRNSTIALVGESGSGKSVTSLAILGLLPPENTIIDPSSQIIFGGRNIVGMPGSELRALRGADISMIFQEPMTSLNPVFTVGFQLEEVLRLHMNLSGAAARKRSIALLQEVGIPEPERSVDLWVRLVVLRVATEVTRFTLNDSGQTARPGGRRRKSRRPCVAPRSSSGHALEKAAPLAEGRGLDGTAFMPRSMLGGSQ